MAQIVINEISQNYTWSIGANNYATVAMPITSCWGPGYFNPASEDGTTSGDNVEKMLERTVWQRFPATQAGLDSFVATYRGAATNYRLAQDFSYQMAITLLTAGYDVLVCRMCPGKHASGTFVQHQIDVQHQTNKDVKVNIRAKYPGTFGNNLQIVIQKVSYYDRIASATKYYWNIITYVIDASGVKSAVESKTCVFNLTNANDSVLYYKEVESKFWEITSVSDGTIQEDADASDISISVGAAYDAVDKNYAVGDYMVYNTKIYKCIKAITKPAGAISAFDSTLTYAVGDVVSYGTSIYRCKTAITAAGEWNADNWNEEWSEFRQNWIMLGATEATKGTDYASSIPVPSGSTIEAEFNNIAQPRFNWAAYYQQSNINDYAYPVAVSNNTVLDALDDATKSVLYYREWLFTHAVGLNLTNSDGQTVGGVYDLLKDKLAYNPQRVISPGWDDQDFYQYTTDLGEIDELFHLSLHPERCQIPISPINLKIMDVAYYSRCATGYIDVPHLVDRKYVHIEDESDPNRYGYVQELARVTPVNSALDVNGSLFHTHSAFFAPWSQFQYVGTSKMNVACPSFIALMIQRAQILNQATQYEWALPTNRKHNLRIGAMDYTVPKKLLDKWQKLDGASVNVITTIPDLGTNIWGNSTLLEVPPATYQALANLSTRFLVNAVEDCAYRCGIGITFQYNNGQAYNKFYAGVTPLLDTMRNVGAIDDYRVEMSADINGEDHVNANTVIGKIWLIVNGVINDIYVDLIALPAGLGIDLNSLT